MSMAAWTLQGRAPKLKPFFNPQVMNEVANYFVEVNAEAFVRAFSTLRLVLANRTVLWSAISSWPRGACHDILEREISKHDALTAILTEPNYPKYSKARFTLFDPDVKDEDDLYTPFRTLFTFVNTFYRVSLATRSLPHDIDAAWPAAFDLK